jgi:hypothetical protein
MVTRFVVSVRREKRGGDVSADLVRGAPGVTVLSATPRGRLVIGAEMSVIQEMRSRFGDLLIIEPEIHHSTL